MYCCFMFSNSFVCYLNIKCSNFPKDFIRLWIKIVWMNTVNILLIVLKNRNQWHLYASVENPKGMKTSWYIIRSDVQVHPLGINCSQTYNIVRSALLNTNPITYWYHQVLRMSYVDIIHPGIDSQGCTM
jgi:hypothetical protein